MIISALINNITLIVALSIFYSLIVRRWEYGSRPHKIISGLLFGAVAIVGMLNPLVFSPGLIFDGRSIIISIGGFIGGPITALIAALMSIAYRSWLGGPGAIMGVSVITSSALIGVAYHYLRGRLSNATRPLYLLGFGLIVHACMLALTMTLPSSMKFEVLKQIAAAVIVIYPLGTLLVCLVLLEQESRILAERSLHRSEGQYRDLVENVNSVILRWDTGGAITFMNDYGLHLFGYQESEIVGRHIIGTIVPQEESTGRDLTRLILDLIQNPRQFLSTENENICREGRRIWISWSNKPIHDEHGHLVEILSVGNDITERKQAEEELWRFRFMVDNAKQEIYLVSPDGQLAYVNQAAAASLGYTIEEMMAMGVPGFDPRFGPKFHEHLEDLKSHDRPPFETVHIAKDGKEIIKEMKSIYLRIANCDYVCGFGVDITERKKVENELRQSEERFSKAFFASPTPAIISTIEDSRCLAANDQCCRMLGYTQEEMIGRITLVWPYPEERSALIEKHLQEGCCRDEQIHLQTRTGEIRDILCSAEIILMEGEEVILSQFYDITEQKRSEMALRQSEERYRTILEEIEDGYQEVDLAGDFTFFNESFRRIFGYSREELMGTNYCIYAADKDNADKVFHAYNRMYRTGMPIKRSEWDIITKDGVRRTIEFFASLLRDSEGRPTGFRGIVRDVTERRLAEEQYRIAAMSSQTGVYIVQDGIFCFANPHISNYSGYSEEELLGTPIMNFVHPDDREMVREKAGLMLKGELTSPYEFRMIDKHHHIRWIMETVTPISYRGRQAVLGNTMDITQQKATEEERRYLESQLLQSQKLEAIGTLAGGIAHDFNNLLMGIQGYASLMLLGIDRHHPHYEKLRSIESQVQSGADLTRQLLGFARGGRYEVKPTDLNALINKSAMIFGRTRKEIRIHEKYARSLWTVDVDHGQIEQVLLNLFVNAWQAMPGGGNLYLETENIDLDETFAKTYETAPGSYVKISIMDTGTGMDEKTRQRIFDPFFTTKEMGRGTGLGLASSYGIIKGHGGSINVHSEKGQGSTFNIYLPASHRAIIKEQIISRDITRGHETILIVDDEEHIIQVVNEMLSGLGYQVLRAGSGEEAIEVFRMEHGRIDLVILDMIMPGISGGEVLDIIKTIDPNIKIILASGYSMTEQAKEIMDRGADAFLQKPFRIADLSDSVRKILGKNEQAT